MISATRERGRKYESQPAVREAIQPPSKSVHTASPEKGPGKGRSVAGAAASLNTPAQIKASVLRALSGRNARKTRVLLFFCAREQSVTKKRLRGNRASKSSPPSSLASEPLTALIVRKHPLVLQSALRIGNFKYLKYLQTPQNPLQVAIFH